jgi:hypothetical protein
LWEVEEEVAAEVLHVVELEEAVEVAEMEVRVEVEVAEVEDGTLHLNLQNPTKR